MRVNGYTIEPGAYLQGADLAGAKLAGAKLDGAYLAGANLEGANLEGANLEGAYLDGAYLEGAYLDGAKLDGAYLDRANLAGANLAKANLEGANLYQANLEGLNLDGLNLDGLNLEGANLSGANLQGANLKEANLEGANLKEANLQGANLEGANLAPANLKGANLEGANLQGAGLCSGPRTEGANLSGANLSGANLSGANLQGTNLEGANLVGVISNEDTIWPEGFDAENPCFRVDRVAAAVDYEIGPGMNLQGANLNPNLDQQNQLRRLNLAGANLKQANLKWSDLEKSNFSGADLTGANLEETGLARAYFPGADLTGANLQGAYFHRTSLPGANLKGANLQGVNLKEANLVGVISNEDTIWPDGWDTDNSEEARKLRETLDRLRQGKASNQSKFVRVTDFSETLTALRKELLRAESLRSPEASRLEQVVILEAIADVSADQVLFLDASETGEARGMGLYDEDMVLYGALEQGWGHWLYSGELEPDSTDQRLGFSLVAVTLAVLSNCGFSGYDLTKRASEAMFFHLEMRHGSQMVRPALEKALKSPSEWRFYVPREDLKEYLDVFGNYPNATPTDELSQRRWSFQNSWVPTTSPLDARQAEMLFAILGPALTGDLIQAISMCDHPDLLSGTLFQLVSELDEVSAKTPEMLLLLAAAAHATAEAEGFFPPGAEYPLLQSGRADAMKHFGDQVFQALLRFGVNPETNRQHFEEWLRANVENSFLLHWREE